MNTNDVPALPEVDEVLALPKSDAVVPPVESKKEFRKVVKTI